MALPKPDKPEVRRVGFTVYLDAAQRALVVASRIEGACNLFECGQVGVIEAVVASDQRIPGIIHLPGAKDALGMDGAERAGIGEFCLKLHARLRVMPSLGLIGQFEMRDEKVQRKLSGRVGFMDQLGIGADNLVHAKSDKVRAIGLIRAMRPRERICSECDLGGR